MYRYRAMRVMGTFIVALVAAAARPASADFQPVPISDRDVDLENCHLLVDGEPQTLDDHDVLELLGLAQPDNRWRGVRFDTKDWSRRIEAGHLVLAFRQPVSVGTIVVGGNISEVAVLRGDVEGAPNALDAAQWRALDTPRNQSGGVTVAAPAGTKTRAVRLTARNVRRRVTVDLLQILQTRLQNITPWALAFAEAEFLMYRKGAPPLSFYASHIPLGISRGWRNSGNDKRLAGRNPHPPISDVEPSWFMLAWDEPRQISGLWVKDNFTEFELHQFVGPDAINPRAGTEAEWKRIRDAKVRREGGHWISFDPVQTRGLKILITKTSPQEPQVASITGLHVFSPLGDRPAERLALDSSAEPPIKMDYEVAVEDATLTMVINDMEGRRVRNLVTRMPREAGQFTEAWDLRNEQGLTVMPGKYQWEAIYHPPLEFRYEMTPYPNVEMHTSENSPWLNDQSGPGGWLADHSSNKSVCVSGDRVYIGAPVSESGVSLLEADLSGKKRWAHPSFAAFTGVWDIAADEETVYVIARGHNIADRMNIHRETEPIWGVDIETKEVRTVGMLEPGAQRKRGVRGAAARDGRLHLAIRAKENYMANAAMAADVDIENCLPAYKPKRDQRVPHEIVPDPRGDFLRLFRLKGTPAGYNNVGLLYLHSTKGTSSRQHIVLAFKTPVPVGSVAYPVPRDMDYRIRLSALKPDASYPPRASDESEWIKFETHGEASWDVATAPPDVKTRALRVSFIKGEDDIFSQLDESEEFDTDAAFDMGLDMDEGKRPDVGLSKSNWSAKLEGMKLLRRRFENVADEAEIRLSSGRIRPDGVWAADRDRPITPIDPAIYAMVWDKPRELRGLAIKEIDGETTNIDVWIGDGPVDEKADDGWQKVASYEQKRRDLHVGFESYNGAARYMDGYVDFGREIETRAVRLRVVKQWTDNVEGRRADFGDRVDRFGKSLDPTRCHVFGVAALRYLGGEDKVDPLLYERIEVLDGHSGEVRQEVFLDEAGDIAFGPDGELFAVSDGRVVRVDFEAGEHALITDDVEQAGPIAVDDEGRIYVYDGAAERRGGRVFDRGGELLRSIGTPGGHEPGSWDPTRLQAVSDIAVDSQDQLWVVENKYWPKRTAVFDTDGTYRREHLGNTSYGGGGVIDPWDKTRVFYGPLEFDLDWQTGETRLKGLTIDPRHGHHAGEVPVKIDGRTYLTTRPGGARAGSASAIVYLYDEETGAARLVAAMGAADQFYALDDPRVLIELGAPALGDHRFLWSDLNGDGKVQGKEVDLRPGLGRKAVSFTKFNRDLGVQSRQYRYAVKEFLPDGTPIYEETHYPELRSFGAHYRLKDGNFHWLKTLRYEGPEGKLTPNGQWVWTYPSEQPGTHGYAAAGPFHPGQVCGHYTIIGHETAHAGDLGEFFVYSGNTGMWHIWTADGMLAGQIFTDLRNPDARTWRMPEHQRGLSLDNVTIGQEHFAGYFGRTFENDKYYAVAGHNHVSVVEIVGLDRFKRIGGSLEVTVDDLKQTQRWEQSREREKVYQRAPILRVNRTRTAPVIDGALNDWPEQAAANVGERLNFRIAYDDAFVYLGYRATGCGPIKNTGEQWKRLFKTGAAVDLKLGLDPDAPADRKAPVEGDLRLLMTFVKGEPIAVLYRAVVPGTPPAEKWEVVSPVQRTSFDRVKQLPEVRLARVEDGNGYTVEAAVPLSSIGLVPKPGQRLKIDWGILRTDRDGFQVLERIYWANKATGIVADAPSEARLHPNLWGHAIFVDEADAADQRLEELDDFSDTDEDTDELIGDFLDELEDDLK